MRVPKTWREWLFFLGVAYVTGIALAYGQPPENADPALSDWYQGLRSPNGSSCCSMADCRPTSYRIMGDHYQAWVDDKWMDVPPEKVLDHMTNPTGRAVVCYAPGLGILCFVRPSET